MNEVWTYTGRWLWLPHRQILFLCRGILRGYCLTFADRVNFVDSFCISLMVFMLKIARLLVLF
jgi:hypothetical protein